MTDESKAIRWKVFYEAYDMSSPTGAIVGSYESFSLREMKKIVADLRKEGVTPAVDKTMPASSWLFLYCLNQFRKKYGAKNYVLRKISVEDMR